MSHVVLSIVLTFLQALPSSPSVSELFHEGQTIEEFVAHAASQQDLWRRNLSEATVAPEFVQRLTRVGRNLRVLVVAEDWCPDSVNTIPFIARLASLAHVELRIVDRTVGRTLMALWHEPSPVQTIRSVATLPLTLPTMLQ